MEAVFLWVWCNSIPYSLGPIRHTFNKLEQDMLDGFRARGRHDLASAFEKRRKYHHAFRNVAPLARLHLTWRRIVFLGEEQAGPGPTTYDEWLEKAMVLYGQDEGFKKYMERIEAQAAAESSSESGESSSGSRSSSAGSTSKESAETSDTEPQPASSAEEESCKPAPEHGSEEATAAKSASTEPAADGDGAEVAVPVTGAVDVSAKMSDAVNDSNYSPKSLAVDTSSMPHSEPATLADDVALFTTTTAVAAFEEVRQVESASVEVRYASTAFSTADAPLDPSHRRILVSAFLVENKAPQTRPGQSSHMYIDQYSAYESVIVHVECRRVCARWDKGADSVRARCEAGPHINGARRPAGLWSFVLFHPVPSLPLLPLAHPFIVLNYSMIDADLCQVAGCGQLARQAEISGQQPDCATCKTPLCPKHLPGHPCEAVSDHPNIRNLR